MKRSALSIQRRSGGARRRIGLLVYFAAGLAIGLYLLRVLVRELGVIVGRDDVLQLAPLGALATGCFLAPLGTAAVSWRLLFPRGRAPGFWHSTHLTWIGLSVNWLLPTALVGGELVKLRLALGRVPDNDDLIASLIGDKTIQVATQLLYTLLGLAVLAWNSGQISGGVREAAGFLLFSGAVYLFYRLQRGGLFSRVAGRLKALVRDRERIETRAGRIDAAVEGMYRRRGRWWLAVAWRMAFRVLMAAEVALVLWWLDQPLAIWSILALESLAQASRVAAMVIPAALGAQEAVILAAGLILGYGPETLIAVAATKRVRELVVGAAGLAAWQLQEARSLTHRDSSGGS